MNRKNLVFLCTDQLRYDALSATGNRVVQTKHIDGIAARGMTFHRHYTPNQICSPSRATMATGRYPRNHGVWRNGVALDETIPNVWQNFAATGYATAAVGKLHFQPLLAPSDRNMPESIAFWDRPDSDRWHGPYYGFDHVDLVLGEANESTVAGHYAAWLKKNHPEVAELYEPEAIPGTRAEDLREVWKSAVPAELHYTNWIADRAIDLIQKHSNAGTPYCLFVSFPDPHHPFAPPKPYCDQFQPSAMPRPTLREGELERMPKYLSHGDDPKKDAYIEPGEQVREQGFLLRTENISDQTLAVAIAHTNGMVQMIDDAVGRIMRAITEGGNADDTYVLFTSDHGELLGDHGLLRKGPPPYRQLLQVPLVLSGPNIKPATHSYALTSHIDLASTIASLLDVAIPATDGIDLTPILSGKSADVRDFLFAEYHPRKDLVLYNQTVVSKRWRFTHYPNEPAWGELFDLETDPWEHWNVFAEDGFSAQVEQLRSVLLQSMPPRPVIDREVLGAY